MGNFILQNTEPKTTVSQFLTSNIKYDGGALGNVPATTNSDLNTVLTDLNSTLAAISSSFAGITGTGTKIAKFTGASTLGDSLLSEAAKVVTLTGTASTLNEFKVNDSAKEISFGVRGSSHSSGVTNNGAQADAFIITGSGINGLNIIKNAGGGSEADYLRFYAGNTPTTTSRIHITGKTSGASEIGNVGINQEVPDKRLEVLDTSTQLRLTHTNASKFVDFTVDTNHDLTIKPSSTGQIKLQPTTDSVDFFQVLDADGGNPVLNVDATNERVGIGTAAPTEALHVMGTSLLTDHLSIANQKELKLFEASGSGTNYTSFKAAATMAGNVTYTYPAAAPLLNGQVLSSTTAGVMTWVDNSTIHVKTEQELLDAFTHFNAVGVSGTVKLGADITLTAHRTLDFNNGIELKGGGHAISSSASAYVLTFDGVTATVKDVMFTGRNSLNTSPTTQNIIKINSTDMKHLSLDCCWFNNVAGHRSASDGVNDYQIIIENSRSAGLYIYMRGIKITSASTDVAKPIGPFKIKLDDADLDSMHFFARDWHLSYGEDNRQPNRFNESRMSCLIKFDNYNTTDHPVNTQKRKFSFDDSVEWHPDSFTNQGGAGSVVAPWLDLYPTFYRNSTPITVAGAGAYLIGGVLNGSGSSYQDARNVFLIFTSGSATSPTIQPDTEINYPIGSEMTIANNGAGTMTLTRGSGVALYNPGGTDANYAINGGSNKYGVVTIKKIAANIWQIINKT